MCTASRFTSLLHHAIDTTNKGLQRHIPLNALLLPSTTSSYTSTSSSSCIRHQSNASSASTSIPTSSSSSSSSSSSTQPSNKKSKRQTFNWLPIISNVQHNITTSSSSSSSSLLPSHVKIVEVSPRDGLQNESQIVPTSIKLQLIERLIDCGLTTIEATSFVSKKWVPQMADNTHVMKGIKQMIQRRTLHSSSKHDDELTFPVLIPNDIGLDYALTNDNENHITEIAIFAAASESFSQANINCSIRESIQRFHTLINKLKQYNQQHGNDIRIRGYVSCVLGCPYEGAIDVQNVIDVTQSLLDLGCYEVSLGDTIGIGNAGSTHNLLSSILKHVNANQVAVHFHDTYGQALSNIYVALQHGIHTVDSSVSGLGGCPYAVGATGNVATEDVVYMLNGLGIESNVKLDKLIDTSWWISKELNRTPTSRVSKAFTSRYQERDMISKS